MIKARKILSVVLSLSLTAAAYIKPFSVFGALDDGVFNQYSTQTYSLTFDEKGSWSEVLSDQNQGTSRLVDSSSKTLSKNIGDNATNAMYFSNDNHQLTMQQEIDNGVISVECDFYISSISAFGNFTILDYHYDYADGTVQNWDGFKVRAYNGFMGGVKLQLAGSEVTSLYTGKWYKIKTVIDRTGEYSGTDKAVVYLYLDNTLVGTKTLSKQIAKLNRVAIKGKTAYVDNFKVTVYGETSLLDNLDSHNLNAPIDMASVKADFASKLAQHPRIMATEADFERIKQEIKTNSDKKQWYDWLVFRGDAIFEQDTVSYTLENNALQKQSARFMNRMITLGMLWKLTGDEKYPERALEEIKTVIGKTDKSFPDWHPGHHIDVGIMASGYAIGYDWMYDYWQATGNLEMIEQGAKDYGVNEFAGMYRTNYTRMTNAATMTNNHNAFCNSGAILFALAFADCDRFLEDSAYIVSNAVRAYGLMNINYKDTEGSWYEGTTYGIVNINFLSMALATMEYSLGNLYEIDTRTPELADTWDYIRIMESDVGNYNFSDADFSPFTYCYGWLENHYRGGGFAENVVDNEGLVSADGEYIAAALLWCSGEGEENKPLDRYYEKDEILLLRSDNKDGQTFVGIKAGDTVYDHSQLDSGSFVFDSQGVRWAYDLGKDDYGIDGYFGFGRNESENLDYGVSSANDQGKRWKIFRNRAESHNTIVINPAQSTLADYKVGSTAPMTYIGGNADGSLATVDMTELYGGAVNSAKRGFILTDSRRSLVVRDEISAKESSDIYWLMYITANAEIDGNRVILTDKSSSDKKLLVDFICDKEFALTIADAKPFNGAKAVYSNDEYKRLQLHTKSDSANITVKLTPINVLGGSADYFDKPIDEWTLNDASGMDALMSAVPTGEVESEKLLLQNITFDQGADISDGFMSVNNYASVYTGSVFPGTSLNWAKNETNQSDSVQIVADKGRSVKLSGKARVNSWIKKTGLVEIEYDVMAGDLGTGRYIKLVDSGFTTKASGGSSTNWIEALRVDYNGNVISGGSNKTGLTMKKNAWYHVSARFDTANGTITTFIDGKQMGVVTNANANTTTTATMLARFNIDTSQCYDASGNYKGMVYIDNLKARTYSGADWTNPTELFSRDFEDVSNLSGVGNDLFFANPSDGGYAEIDLNVGTGNRYVKISADNYSEVGATTVNPFFMSAVKSADGSKVTSGLVKYEKKVYFPDFNSLKYITIPYFATSDGTSRYANSFVITPIAGDKGAVSASDDRWVYYKTIEKNKWYTLTMYVDLDTNIQYFCLDGELLHQAKWGYDMTYPIRVNNYVVTPSGDAVSEIYMDDITISWVEKNSETFRYYAGEGGVRALAKAQGDSILFGSFREGRMVQSDVYTMTDKTECYDHITEGETVKIMMWDGVETMMPSKDAVIVDLK